MRLGLVICSLVLGSLSPACGDGDVKRSAPRAQRDPSPVAARPASGVRPTISERRGTYRGIGIGSTRGAIERVMGRSRSGNNAFFGPLSTDPYDYGLPVTPREPPGLDPAAIWQFKHMAAVADRKRAWLVGVTATDAATKRGLAIANELDAVQHAYPNARCGIENRDTGWPEFPYCEVRVARQRYVYFGEDPIRSISLSRAPMANTR